MQSKGVSLAKLEELYQKAVKLSGFTEKCENPIKDRWSRQIEPGIFDLRVVHGLYNDQPAIMQVGVKEMIMSKSDEHLYQMCYVSRTRAGSIHIPRILLSFVTEYQDKESFFLVIHEKLLDNSVPFLPRFPFSTSHQKKMIADLYWNTVNNFSKMREDEKLGKIMAKNEGQLFSLYFSRLNRWLEMGENAWQKCTGTKGEKQREKEECEKDRKIIIEIIAALKNTHYLEESGLSVELFFKHFGYTDMVYREDIGQFGLPMAGMGIYPQYYGAAYWVWNILMHSFNQSSDWARQEVGKWYMAFVSGPPRSEGTFPHLFSLGFHFNLLERVVATLLVDIPLERSPFDKNSSTRKEKGRNIFRKILEERYKN